MEILPAGIPAGLVLMCMNICDFVCNYFFNPLGGQAESAAWVAACRVQGQYLHSWSISSPHTGILYRRLFLTFVFGFSA